MTYKFQFFINILQILQLQVTPYNPKKTLWPKRVVREFMSLQMSRLKINLLQKMWAELSIHPRYKNKIQIKNMPGMVWQHRLYKLFKFDSSIYKNHKYLACRKTII